MKLWDELTEKEQKAVIRLAKDIYKIINEGIVEPLTEIIDELSFFFIALDGIIREEKYKKKCNHLTLLCDCLKDIRKEDKNEE